ncbi:tetratricopeptide repeat-containing response regulator [Massilia cavernae]|uniref:Response regulator n=1 Tax=Massilia cavernae TaxID=2320864 RepID=A0A418Y4X0_9BURK|nr:tetratricopeptide repeat-containing response regulator [Massilia cavernae]RJG21180.1 response regulator [Massilia cavernae]
MQDNSNLSVLVIDPNPGMRGSLQNMLSQLNISKVEFAVSSGTAIRQLSRRSYDIILCEYDLDSGGEHGQDGQQLLEDLRHHKLIGMWTIFIMLTSEGVYNKVVSAAELAPTAYVLKPFTVDVLSQRIGRAIDRRTIFLPTYQLIGQGNTREAIRSCIAGENAHPRHAADFVRLRAELHLSLNEYPEAEHLYAAMLGAKAVGWASLGLARAVFAQGRIDEAAAILTDLVAANPRLMAAYDLLARCHEASGTPQRAQQVLEEAVSISPHMVRRLRKLGEVAFEAGDVNAAEKSFKQVVAKAKYSEFRDPEDHVNLVKTLVKKGDATQASSVIRDLERSLRGSPNVDVCKSISVAMLHDAAGNNAAAISELNNAVGAVRASSGLSSKLKITLAKSCLAHKLDHEASEVMLSVMNDVNSDVSTQQAMGIFVKAGRPDLADGMGAQLKAQAQILLGIASEKTNMGDLKGAVHSLLEAMHMAPGNLQVMIAVARGILRQLGELGWDHALAETCQAQIDAIHRFDASHPQLEPLVNEYNGLKRKYGIATT